MATAQVNAILCQSIKLASQEQREFYEEKNHVMQGSRGELSAEVFWEHMRGLNGSQGYICPWVFFCAHCLVLCEMLLHERCLACCVLGEIGSFWPGSKMISR